MNGPLHSRQRLGMRQPALQSLNGGGPPAAFPDVQNFTGSRAVFYGHFRSIFIEKARFPVIITQYQSWNLCAKHHFPAPTQHNRRARGVKDTSPLPPAPTD